MAIMCGGVRVIISHVLSDSLGERSICITWRYQLEARMLAACINSLMPTLCIEQPPWTRHSSKLGEVQKQTAVSLQNAVVGSAESLSNAGKGAEFINGAVFRHWNIY